MERQIPVRELNQHTSAVLAEVAAGSAVTITKAGRPVARIVPLQEGTRSVLDDWIAAGRATGPSLAGPVPMPPGDEASDLDVGQLIADGRQDERW